MRALIIEDEPRLARNISLILQENGGFVTDVCHDGDDGYHMASTNPYDLIVLDLMLPGMNGIEILRKLRANGNNTGILILTARDSQTDIVNGLNNGADDYLTKPFDIGELLARCRAVVRRLYGKANPQIQAGKIVIDSLTKKVFVDGNEITLTAMEYRTLEYLAMRAGEVVSKSDLLEHLYDFNWERYSNVMEVYISNLRKKIDSSDHVSCIETVRGHGYLLRKD